MDYNLSFLRRVVRGTPFVRELAGFLLRAKTGLFQIQDFSRRVLRWVFTGRETTNYTYELEPDNESYLAAFIANASNRPIEAIISYIHELKSDEEVANHIKAMIKANPGLSWATERRPLFGRRLGWYALLRAVKPKTVVETGVDKGLGSCVLTAALKRNAEEGSPGYFYGRI